MHNWANSGHFRLALGRARESKALFWREEAEQPAVAAVHTIRALMIEASTPAIVRLKAAGIDGIQLSFYDFKPDLTLFGESVLPLLKQVGLRL